MPACAGFLELQGSRLKLKTGENSARKCTTFAYKFQNCFFGGRGHIFLPKPHSYPSAPYYKFLDTLLFLRYTSQKQ